jgi:CRISP-associated protein Cas1
MIDSQPLIPLRMLNEYVYCPRLAYLEWVQGEFVHSADTVDGAIKHKRVDKGGGRLPENPVEEEKIHARSVTLSSERLGISGKLDLVEGEGLSVTPVDYKRGKRPHIPGHAYAPERVQVCGQGLLLREHGFSCDRGVIYFVGSKERVAVDLDETLIRETLAAIEGLKASVLSGRIPPPLEDSPKCIRCSLAGICLPDETAFLGNMTAIEPRPIFASDNDALPLYVQTPGAYVRKSGEQFIVEVEKEKTAEIRISDVSQVVLYGHSTLTTPALHECLKRDIPVTFLSYGGWFLGHTTGTGHRNVETRIAQYRASFDPDACLRISRSLVAAKIQNCRTLLRRNWKGTGDEMGACAPGELLADLMSDADHAGKAAALDTLLGIEGAAASRYFRHLPCLLKRDADQNGVPSFDFTGRNRRPPKDPVNAMLSLGYAMLARQWTVTLSAVGLDPYQGFYHQPRFGRPALALDMMEPFRPLIADSTVITCINNGEIKSEDFLFAAGGCTLKDSGRKRFIKAFERRLSQEITHPVFNYRISYRRLFEVQARLLIRHLTGEIPEFPNFVTR